MNIPTVSSAQVDPWKPDVGRGENADLITAYD